VICNTPNTCSWLVFNFVKNFFFCNAILSLTAKIAVIHFETREIAKMLHNVYKGSWVGKYLSFEETFHHRFAVLALNVHGLRHRSKSYLFSPGW
jgi:hypothetical protein